MCTSENTETTGYSWSAVLHQIGFLANFWVCGNDFKTEQFDSILGNNLHSVLK